MIPPDLTDVSQESPREVCGNLSQTFRLLASEAASGAWPVGQRDFERWADRLERACQRIDEEKPSAVAVHALEKIRHAVNNVVAFPAGAGDNEIWYAPIPSCKLALVRTYKVANAALSIVGAVSPTAPPAEHQEDQ